MKTPEQSGFTRTELIVVVVAVVLLALVLYPIIRSARDQAVLTTMKSRGRAIWLCHMCG
jgi:Tfp pilus assembly protein PilE